MQYCVDGRGWREEMTEFLIKMGITVLDPYKKPFINAPEEDEQTHQRMAKLMENGDYAEVAKHFKKVRAFDLSMVDRSDFIICYIDPNIPSFGTMEELSSAVLKKRPCFIIVEGGIKKTPLWIMGMLPTHYIYNSFDEVKDILLKINSGEKEIDSDRWRLFKDCYR